MSDWYSCHRLFHYTKSEEIVAAILQHGFLLVPNQRHLISAFLPGEDFSKREPQEFGMVSFTELESEQARTHREQFGAFGICVSWDWALRNNAQRVIYVEDDGVVFSKFKWLFELARQELATVEERGSQASTNKALAAVYGAQLYHVLLTLYEYMEPLRNSSQVEWRIVNQLPMHHDLRDRSKLLQHLIETSRVSPMVSVPVTRDDIEFLICPKSRAARLRESLPSSFEGVPIFSYSTASQWRATLSTLLQWTAELRKSRDRVRYIPYEPPRGTLLLPLSGEGSGVVQLPRVAKMNGLAFHPDRVRARQSVSVQYEDSTNRWFELHMGVEDALYLLKLLAQHAADPRVERWR